MILPVSLVGMGKNNFACPTAIPGFVPVGGDKKTDASYQEIVDAQPVSCSCGQRGNRRFDDVRLDDLFAKCPRTHDAFGGSVFRGERVTTRAVQLADELASVDAH